MIELSKHIQYLLLENDCVIVPDLGGFIAHYQPARYDEKEGVYVPPIRTIGFNPQLTMNDGLLVQSFMQTHHTDFPDATRLIAAKVDRIKELLYHEGVVEFQGVGSLYYNIQNHYEFHPMEQGILSPILYGLGPLELTNLSEKPVLLPKNEQKDAEEVLEVMPAAQSTGKQIHFHPHVWMRNAAAVAAAIILSVLISVPVENTYIDEGNYASLGSDGLFDEIRDLSLVTTLFTADVEQDHVTKKRKSLRPVSVRTEKVGKKVDSTALKKAAPAQKVEAGVPAAQEQQTPVKRAEITLPGTTVQKSAAQTTQPVQTVTPVKKVEAQTPAVKPASKPVAKATPTTVSSGKRYHIIVASLDNTDDAQKILQSYQQKGYGQATIIKGNGRYRVSLNHFSQKAEAYRQMNQLKKNDAFKSAWMLTVK